jgi:hypothetical protein
MQRISIPLVLFELILVSCDCNPEQEFAFIHEGNEILVDYDSTYERHFYSIVNGNKLIFEYRHVAGQCDSKIGDEWAESIKFQIEDSTTKFMFVNDEILSTNCFYEQIGTWTIGTHLRIETGTIEGERISDNKWKMLMSIETSPVEEGEPIMIFQIEETFMK